ncbi:MAG: 2-amino-4-hydroxy-6-hydroxymethyldihydropteridine diphosphokinase [Victivallaceae bacterium]|nr:2-amino-4-hydroxy-6-hydroxymethyldihydropteridine diphosphokinase [Victivallaceae bacterium]
MAIIYLGIGSNLGDREKHIQDALNLLPNYGVTTLKQSTLIETDPVGGPPQGKFLNGALKAETSLDPNALLSCLKSIETELGRKKSMKNGPRPIDIDILLYDNIVINTPMLTIPHPQMLERDFVMRPLQEIEPDIIEQLNT